MSLPLLVPLTGINILLGVALWLLGERGHVRLQSTKKWFRDPHWSPKGRWINALHGYLYMRWQNQYIKHFVIQMGAIAPKPVREYFKDHYHSKVLTHENAVEIIKINENIPLQDLEQVVPYPNARNFLLSAPPEIIVYECGCRNSRENHCETTQVCMWIGQPYIDFILEHNPNSSRRLTQEEALKLLEEEHNRGHVHTAWFKDAMQDRFYCICNCCSCCCAGIEAMRKYGTPFLAASGYLAQINHSLCKICGHCAEVCPFEAVVIGANRVDILAESCMGCAWIHAQNTPFNLYRIRPSASPLMSVPCCQPRRQTSESRFYYQPFSINSVWGPLCLLGKCPD